MARGSDTKDKLLEAALQIVWEEGVGADAREAGQASGRLAALLFRPALPYFTVGSA